MVEEEEVVEDDVGFDNSCFFFCHSMKFPSHRTKRQMEDLGSQGKVEQGFNSAFL